MFIKQAIACLVILIALLTAAGAMAADDTASHEEQFYSQADRMRHQALKQNETCFTCHGKREINSQWKTDRGRTLQLYVDPVDYRNSVHSGQSCQSCHEGAGPEAFASAPHKFKDKQPVDCMTCHKDYFKDIAEQTKRSYHTKAIVEKGKPFPCSSCHNAHSFRLPERTEDIPGSIAQANERCFQCHNDLRGYEALTDKKLLDQNMAHWFLPHKEKHFAAVRCVDCHAANKGTDVHVIMQVKDMQANGAMVDCEYCHSKSSAMLTKLNKYRNEQKAFSMVNKGLFDDKKLVEENAQLIVASTDQADSVLGFMNASLLDSKYVTGITQTPVLNARFMQLLAVILLVIVVHSVLRMSGTKAIAHGGTVVTMFPLLVRVWHWINAALFLVLIVSGFSMHFGAGMSFKAAQSTHATLAIGLAGMWMLYVLYLILSGQIMQYLPRADFISATFKQLRYYMFGIYKGEENPAGHDPRKRLNPLQQASYVGVLFILFPALVVSGVYLFIPDLIPAKIMGMEGERFVSLAHTASAFLMVVFLVVHLYLCTTGESVFALVRSMITGKMKNDKEK
ncbi:cytochrome b/b6 domain-containing protein [Desulfovibrio sp. Huiquan2017]|uniref:cytochrome b/b6 domain-containing protein n=1 Tax=Desulfovibrio sp. Huiquan2017 TaxID=2816861 RepID=UPI001A925338|nr:cytochrome b/b6 domain-containing protein [Desulfovibrio sp. Huiquan2017]